MDILEAFGSIGPLFLFISLGCFIFLGFILIFREQRIRQSQHASRVHDILSADEAIRRELARDLHDDIAQELAAARMLCERAAEEEDQSVARERARAAALLLAECGKKVRGLSRRLRPPELESEGLAASIRALCVLVRKIQGIEVAFHTVEDLPRFDLDIETHCYRIIHEAVVNALKHASNHRISIRLSHPPRKKELLRIEVINEGTMPAREALVPGLGKGYGGLGIPGMQERALLVGGRFSIQQMETRTRVCLDIPLRPIQGEKQGQED